MTPRRLLLIDDDADFHRTLNEQLGPYGFEVHQAKRGADPLGQVREVGPEIIFIAVDEPDKLGYSLCNRAKKGVAREIPVVLTTATVPSKGFNSHRQLKVHADEYIDKRTMTAQELVAKVDAIVVLGERIDGGADEMLPGNGDEGEIALNEEEISFVEELDENSLDVQELAAGDIEIEDYPEAPGDRPNEFDDPDFDDSFDKTRIAPPAMLFDHAADEGDMAGEGATSRRTGGAPGAEFAAAGSLAHGKAAAETEDRSSVNRRLAALLAAGPKPRSPLPEMENDAEYFAQEPQDDGNAAAENRRTTIAEEEVPLNEADIDLGLDQAAEMALEEQSGAHDRRALQRATVLEEENARLKAERERAASESGSFSQEREFLNLRELINQKEKEVHELGDEIVDKDRQLAEGTERIRQLEHAKAALDRKNAELEEQLLAAREAESEREREGRTRRDGGEALQAELEQLRHRLAEATEKAKELEEALRSERAVHRSAMEDLEARHAAQLDSIKSEIEDREDAAREQLRAEHAAAIATLRQAHEEELEAEKTARQELAANLASEREQARAEADAQRHQDFEATQERIAEAVQAALEDREKSFREEHERRTEEMQRMRREYAEEIDRLEAEHAEDVARLEREKAEALAQGEGERNEERARVEELLAELRQRLTAARQSAKEEIEALQEARREASAALEAERDQLRASLETARQHQERLQRESEAKSERMQEHDRQMDELRETLSAQEERLASLGKVLEEMEDRNAEYQEQVLRAHRKIKSDEETVDKAKRAIAVALTLLDDHIEAVDDEGGGDTP